jgi:hypothetical protein
MARRLAASPPSFADLLARARGIAPQLGSATDELNAALTRAEKAIASLRLGVTASVTLSEQREEDAPYTRLECLTFGKDGAHWRLLIERGIEDEPETWTSTPLVNASREVRVLAADRLPELLEKLIANAEEQVE